MSAECGLRQDGYGLLVCILVLLEFVLGGVGFVGISVGWCWFCWNFCWGCWLCWNLVLGVLVLLELLLGVLVLFDFCVGGVGFVGFFVGGCWFC